MATRLINGPKLDDSPGAASELVARFAASCGAETYRYAASTVVLSLFLGLSACTGTSPTKNEGPHEGPVMTNQDSAERNSQQREPATIRGNREKANKAYVGHGTASVDQETIKAYAPSPLSPDVSRRIQAMLDVKAPGMGLVTPDGRRLVFGWSISGTPQVWRADGPKTFPRQMTGGNDATQVVGLTTDGKWIVISRDQNGEENPGIYLQSIEGGPLKKVFHEHGVRASLSWISDDGRGLYYSANDQKPDAFTLYKNDLRSGTRDEVFNEPGLWALADVSPSGKQLLMTKLTGALSREYWLFEPRTKSLTPLLGQGESVEYEVSFGYKPDQFVVLTNKLGDFRRLYLFSNGKLTPLSPERQMDVESFQIDRPRKKIIFSWNDQGYSRLGAIDARSLKTLSLPEFPGADHVFVGSFTIDGRYMTIGSESATTPRVSYVYDWNTKRLVQWVAPSSPEIDTSRFSPAILDSYVARDGTKIPMLVRKPSHCASRVCPVVVDFHGGPEGQSRPGFSPWIQLFVDAGFVFVQPNVRGSDGYGKSWLTSDDGRKRLDVITDIEDVARHLRKSLTINGVEPKIGIMGGSYGGYAALMGMTRFAGAFDAGVASVGMSNLVTFLENTAPYRRKLRISEYGDPKKDREALQKLSPITYFDQIKAPLLIIQGVSDPRVPAGEAIQMHEAMRSKGLDSKLILFADEGHGSVKRENRAFELGHTIAFFQKYLTGGTGQKTSSSWPSTSD